MQIISGDDPRTSARAVLYDLLQDWVTVVTTDNIQQSSLYRSYVPYLAVFGVCGFSKEINTAL